MVRGAAFGLAAGMACALVMLVLSRLVMIPDAKSWAGAALAAAGILCALGNMLRKVSDRDAAVQADRCGLMERAATALDASPDEAADEIGRAMREMQIRDACEALKNLDPKKIRPGSVRRPLAAAGIAITVILFSFINSFPPALFLNNKPQPCIFLKFFSYSGLIRLIFVLKTGQHFRKPIRYGSNRQRVRSV